ncbi:MAG: tetratricopeptide repeat protein [Gallionellaceae bacterium]|jgi:tetratricopeptide (TPR) repeat protein
MQLKLNFSQDRNKALLLVLLVLIVYVPFLNNPLAFDDATFFNNSISNFADAPFVFNFRWFPYTSFGITWAFFGGEPFVFRVQNLLLHGMNVLMLMLALRLWISLFVAEPARQHMANWGAWLGALVFACHPLAVYGTGYLVQRSILMATLFTLVMHLAYFRALIDGDKRYAALAVAGYFLAVFSKEHSLMVPAILLPMTWLMRAQIQLSRRALLATWLGFFVTALIVVMRAKGILGATYEMDAVSLIGKENMLQGVPMLHLLSVLTQAELFFKYLFLMIIPNPAWMSIDMRENFILAYRDWTSWIGLAAYVSYGLGALFCLLRGGRLGLLGLALLYPWLLFLTEFSTIRIQEPFVLYRAYLWMPVFLLLVPLLAGVGRIPCTMVRKAHPTHFRDEAHGQTEKLFAHPARTFMLIAALIALVLVPLSWNRLWVMADNYRLWDDAVKLLHGENRLGAQRTYYGRGYYAAKDKGDWNSAIEDYKKSLEISTAFPPVRMALAGAYANAGRNDEARIEYDKAIEADPQNAEFYYGKAFFLKKMRDDAGAMITMQKSCDLGKDMACAMVNLSKLRK